MSQPCGCCVGTEIVVPLSEANPPGRSVLRYRVGTYAEFFETMLARLTGLTIDVPSTAGTGIDRLQPLAGLTTRALSDPTIALLDAWAIVGDVLTFYQERIANEGFLPTALERRSVLELARLIGYRLRPGVAASVKLAFTVASGFSGTLPAGTRAQSIPGTGESPQFFETSAPLVARDSWNALSPRLTRPQLITPAAASTEGVPLVTGADVIDSVYLDGIATNLKPGDALLFIFGSDTDPVATPRQQYLRPVAEVNAQADQKRTQVTLGLVVPPDRTALVELELYADKAKYLFPGSDLAEEVGEILETVVANVTALAGSTASLGPILRPAISRIALKRDVAIARGFSRVAAWLAVLLTAMQRMSLPTGGGFAPSAGSAGGRGSSVVLKPLPAPLAASPLARLDEIAAALARPAAVQPANALRLTRTVAQSFTPQSDLAPRLLAALRPALAPVLYPALSSAATPSGRVEVYATRVKASLFAASWAGPATLTQNNGTTTVAFGDPPNINTAWGRQLANLDSGVIELPLDAVYDQIKPGSWVVVDRPTLNADGIATGSREVTYHVVVSTRSSGLATGGTGFASKVTLLTLEPPWLDEYAQGPERKDLRVALSSPDLLRQTVVFAQSEPLALTEEPLDADVEGDTIDLAIPYDGLEPGRWIVVSGTRVDLPNVSGVTAAELAMIAGVTQGAQAPVCATFPLADPPFAQVWYTTDANTFGDRLVVGILRDRKILPSLPDPTILNQQYCDQAELAAGLFVNAYVPSAEERRGRFPEFEGLLVDQNGIPFEGGNIAGELEARNLFAWRISSPAVHTILTLANALSYSYDRGSVTIYGNVADATHGQTTGEVLGNGDATRAFASFSLGQNPLTYVSAATPSGASSTLTLRVNELAWHELPDLAEATPDQRGFVTREDQAQKTSVTFGNGAHGARPPTGVANVKATYRYGIGAAGNVRAGQISQLATHPLGAQGVVNPLPASGGADPDRLDQARVNAPMAVMALDRLVSVRDYADFSRTYAGIGKAVAARMSDGRRQLVHVTVAGVDDIPIDLGSDLLRNLLTSLQTYGDPNQPVELAIRRARLIVMEAGVALLPDYAWEDVAPAVRTAILAQFAFEARSLGQTAFLSEAIQVAQQVEGVAYVNVTRFGGVPDSATATQIAALGGTLGLDPYVPAELARVDPTVAPGFAGRILPAEIVFMTADIPDTLILSQIGG